MAAGEAGRERVAQVRDDGRARTIEQVLHEGVEQLAADRRSRDDQRRAITRLQHEEPDHEHGHQAEHGRAADRRQIEERILDPRRTERLRRIERVAQRAQDLRVEGLRVAFRHLTGEADEGEEEQAQAEPDEEPGQLAAVEPSEPEPWQRPPARISGRRRLRHLTDRMSG